MGVQAQGHVVFLQPLFGRFLDFVKPFDARFGFAGSRGWGGPHPFEFALKNAPGLGAIGQCVLLALLPFFQVIAVVALVLVKGLVVQFEDGVAHVFQKITIVRDHQNGHFRLGEVALEPLDHVQVQVVGRLVQEQDVGLFNQDACQGNPPPLAAAQRGHGSSEVVEVEPSQHLFRARFEVPCIVQVHAFIGRLQGFIIFPVSGCSVDAHGLHDRHIAGVQVVQNRLLAVVVRILRQVAPLGSSIHADAPVIHRFNAAYAVEQGGFSSAVLGDDGAFLATGQTECQPFEEQPLAVALGQVFCGKNIDSGHGAKVRRAPGFSRPFAL